MTTPEASASEFKTLIERIRLMHSKYFHALSAFYAYEGLLEALAPNVVGKAEAVSNAEAMGKYKDFFIPAREALRVYFFLELAKLFDVSDQSLHISKIINYTERHLKSLTVEEFEKFNIEQNRTLIEHLVKEYRGMDYSELMEIKTLLNKHEVKIKNLKDYRDGWIAHNDISHENPPKITAEDLKELFNVLERILNIISGKLNSETWSYTHLESSIKGHTKMVLSYLGRFEPYRIKEIEKETARKLRAIKRGNFDF